MSAAPPRECPRCKSENFGARPNCLRCGAALPQNAAQPAAPAAEPAAALCPVCCNPVVQQARFCHHCGTALTVPDGASPQVCAACGAAVKPGKKFCTQCGAKLCVN